MPLMPATQVEIGPYDGLDAKYEAQEPALCAGSALLGAGPVAATGANIARGSRIIVPRTGTLHDLAVYIGTSSGNYDIGVYDTSAATRNALYRKGSTASPGTGWQILADPGIAVVAGDQIDFAIAFDNGSATVHSRQVSNNLVTRLPDGFWVAPGGAAPFLYWAKTSGAFPLPSTILESTLLGSLDQFLIIGRVS